MRLGVLQDITFAQRPGGAARAADLWLNNIPVDIGDNQVVVCPPGQLDPNCDGYLLLLTKQYSDEELGFISQNKPFIRYEFDYWPSVEPQSKWRDVLNDHADLIMFPSALHRDVYMYRHHVQHLMPKTLLLPPPVDLEQYTVPRMAWDQKERKDAIWFGEWHWFKGPDIAMNWALRNETFIDMFTPGQSMGEVPPHRFVRLRGFHPEPGWFDTIASHEYFVHFAREPQCFSYAIIEAFLLGCKVVVGGRTGVESWLESGMSMEELVDRCDRSRTDLWKITFGEQPS